MLRIEAGAGFQVNKHAPAISTSYSIVLCNPPPSLHAPFTRQTSTRTAKVKRIAEHITHIDLAAPQPPRDGSSVCHHPSARLSGQQSPPGHARAAIH